MIDLVDKCADLARYPIDNDELEQFQQDYFGDSRHYYYRFLYHLVQQTKPKIAIELGIEFGHGCVHMAKASHSFVVGIDKSPKWDRKYCQPNLEIVRDSTLQSESVIKKYTLEYGKIGVVFQDSSHHYHESKAEFELFSKYLSSPAIWVCDDITPDFHDPLVDPPGKSMVDYFEELPGRKKKYDDLHHGSIIGVTVLNE